MKRDLKSAVVGLIVAAILTLIAVGCASKTRVGFDTSGGGAGGEGGAAFGPGGASYSPNFR
jgi:hypothetical protein